MQPELFPGDILIATKGRFKSLKVGDKIIFSVPGYPMMVKKIIADKETMKKRMGECLVVKPVLFS